MTIEEIEKKVISLISKSLEGLESESTKFDFKSIWYNLKSEQGIAEFIKDTTSIANTIGLDGFIVIGFDEKNGTYHNSIFSNSGLKDTNEVPNLINKRCSGIFDFDIYDIQVNGNNMSVIHIPPTLEKPIVILNHKSFRKDGLLRREERQRILIRKSTGTHEATKNDIEMMFYDRKNIIPKYQYEIDLVDVTLSTNRVVDRQARIDSRTVPLNVLRLKISFDNYGKRSIALKAVSLYLENEIESIEFEGKTVRVGSGAHHRSVVNNVFCTIEKESILQLDFSFEDRLSKQVLNLKNYLNLKLGLTLSNGKVISSILKIKNSASVIV